MTGDGGALPPPPLSVSVDLDHPTPPYEQIRGQIAAHLSAGALRPGDRLPTVRALAADLGVAVGTVSRAYRELEQEGAVTSRRRTGTVVSRDAPGTADRPGPDRSGPAGAAGVLRPGRAPDAAGAAGPGAPAPRSGDPLDGDPVTRDPAAAAAVTAGAAAAPRSRPGAGSDSLGPDPDPARRDAPGRPPAGGPPPGGAGPGGEDRGGEGRVAANRSSAGTGGADPSGRGGVAGLVAAADALAAAAVRAGVDDRDVLTLVSGALLLARRP